MNFDVIIIGAGPGGIYSAYELTQRCPQTESRRYSRQAIALAKPPLPHRRRKGQDLHRLQNLLHHERLRRRGRLLRRKIQHHQRLRRHALTSTSARSQALELMRYVDEINMTPRRRGHQALHHRRIPVQESSASRTSCNLLDASVRHLGTDINYVVLENLYRTI